MVRPGRRSTVPSRVGSHQSSAEVEAMMPEQHTVLEAAAARKSGKSPATERAPRKSIGIAKPKKLFSYKKLSSTPEKRGKFDKTHKAIFNLVRAKYQKGDKKDALTGAVYMRGKPRYQKGNKERFKDKVHAKSLSRSVRAGTTSPRSTGSARTRRSRPPCTARR